MNTLSKLPSEGTLIEAAHASALQGSAMPRIMREFAAGVVGRRIAKAGYLVQQGSVWPCLVLEDGSSIIIQSDDEGNRAGVPSWANCTDCAMLCRTNLAGGAS